MAHWIASASVRALFQNPGTPQNVCRVFGRPKRFYSNSGAPFVNILVEARGEKNNVGYIQLNRKNNHNAISPDLSKELYRALVDFENDEQIGAVVYTGGEKIFTVGADIPAMKGYGHLDMVKRDFSEYWNKIHTFRKPIVAAVNGYCVGGGTETIMMCDVVYAGEKAQFGQPEIKIGIIPGAGGSQRLPKAIGKSKAMEAILTANLISAQQAMDWGLISKVFPVDQVIPEAIKLAERIAAKPRVAAMMAKQAVKLAYEVPLSQGVQIERTFSVTLAATKDFKEGMAAFLEKREAVFTD
ncbi:Enoyl-CoA hydratase, mitochondrial [Hypsibius exemplaris]|uniref:enoyl-CoA hydratase n=1 Tax=Hypsibius exemplaris TaxID=2072580 RepID=A0A9X6NEI2_HYPEX|nr:Enoyl-CoA hydratase, mitochondrial [Hypsibius exemplaris]